MVGLLPGWLSYGYDGGHLRSGGGGGVVVVQALYHTVYGLRHVLKHGHAVSVSQVGEVGTCTVVVLHGRQRQLEKKQNQSVNDTEAHP